MTARRLAAGAGLVATLVCAPEASANEFVPSIALQTGVAATRTAGGNNDDYFVAATPQLVYFIEGERKLISLTYALTGSLNTFLPNSISNRLEIATASELGPTTRLLFSVEALQSLIGNYILVRRAASSQLGGINSFNASLLSIGANQALAHEFTPRLRLTQTASVQHVTSLDPDLELNNTLGIVGLNIERAWDFNAIGADLTVQYARTDFPPLLATIYTVAFGPTWDHDFSTNLSMSLGAGGQVAASTDANLGARFGPYGNASLFYGSPRSGVGLEYAGGVEPNLLIGTLFQSHQVTLRGAIPLSEGNRVYIGGSAGYQRATILDLAEEGTQDSSFDAVLHDAEITWDPIEALRLSIRYQFIGQTSGTAPSQDANTPPLIPAIVRHAAILGVELFGSRPGGRRRAVPTRFVNRADNNDPTVAPTRSPNSIGPSNNTTGPAMPGAGSTGGMGIGNTPPGGGLP